MNRDWRKPDFSFFVLVEPAVVPSSESFRVSLLLLMRKKFLIRCDTCPSFALTDLLVDRALPEKVRFSVMAEWLDVDELKSWVMAVGAARQRERAAGYSWTSSGSSSEAETWRQGGDDCALHGQWAMARRARLLVPGRGARGWSVGRRRGDVWMPSW